MDFARIYFALYVFVIIASLYHAAHVIGGRLNERRSQNDIRRPLLKAITSGSKLALERCQTEFRWEKWNCPFASFVRRHREPITKEIAFIAAVQSAGVTYEVAKTCSMGTVPSCGCYKTAKCVVRQEIKSQNDSSIADINITDEDEAAQLRGNWRWSGCIDEISMGIAVSSQFFESLEMNTEEESVRSVNKHNTLIGAHSVKYSSQVTCHCYGILGSCVVKTCWRKLIPFQDISKKLKLHYRKAQQVQTNGVNGQIPLNLPNHKLIFLESTPDYCKPNASIGWPGTGGRICSLVSHSLKVAPVNESSPTDKSEKRSCRELCRSCGHQVRQRSVNVTWNCNCSFQACCAVKCDTCHKTIMQAYCDERQSFKASKRPVKLN